MSIKFKFSFILKFKKLIFNFSIRSVANLISKLLGLITLPIITRALGPESYGYFNLVNVIIQYTLLPVGLLGLQSYGIREIAAKRKEVAYANEILSMQFSIGLISIATSFLICFFLLRNNSLLIIAISIGYLRVISQSLNLEFFYVSQKNLAFPTYASLFGQIFYVLGVFMFIKDPNDFPLLIFFSSLTMIISDVIQIRKYHFDYSNFKLKTKIREVINTFKKTYILGLSQNIQGFIGTIPILILQLLAGAYALGIFTGAMKLYTIIVLFYNTFFYALSPYLVQLNDYSKKIRLKYHLFIFCSILCISLLVGLILYIFGEPIVQLILGEKFNESIKIFKLISLILIPISSLTFLLSNILVYSQQEKYFLYTLIINLISVLLGSIFFIPKFHQNGAIYAIILASMLSLSSLIIFYYKVEFNK